MYKSSCIINEENFVYYLNGKRVSEINNNLKTHLKRMYGNLDEDEIIECGFIEHFQKPDVYIIYKGQRKTISLKTGIDKTVHEENIHAFANFLRELGVSEENVIFFIKYCYGDDSIDGNGAEQFSYIDLKVRYIKETKKFNDEFIKNKDVVKRIVYRCLFKGSREENEVADYIYFGTVNYGQMCSKRQIFTHIDRRDWRYMDNPHIGPLQFRAHYRGHDLPEIKQKRRHQADLWWANLGPDIDFISQRYDD